MQIQALWWGATVLFFLIAGKAFVLAEDASAGDSSDKSETR